MRLAPQPRTINGNALRLNARLQSTGNKNATTRPAARTPTHRHELARRDLATLDGLRGHTDRSTYLRGLLRRAGRTEKPELEADDESFQPFNGEHLERLRVLTA